MNPKKYFIACKAISILCLYFQENIFHRKKYGESLLTQIQNMLANRLLKRSQPDCSIELFYLNESIEI